jgi:proteasome lid subunit RPN8/RPN11
MKLVLPARLQERIAREALAAFPRECCGLIEGINENGTLHALALHPGRNLASSADRFELDPVDHIAALKASRAAGHVLIGCYHSHPDGKAEPSPRDLGGAAEADFLWLIAATDGVQCRLAGFVYRRTGFESIGLVPASELAVSSLLS